MKEVLRCLLHTILFNRALGPTEPREQDCELFDVTYVRCGDINVDKSVEVALSSFSDALSTGAKPVGPDLAKGRLLLSFYEIKKKSGWLGTTEEKVYWEQWIFPVLVNRRPRVAGPKGSPEAQESSRRQLNAEEALKATIIRILDHISKQVLLISSYKYR
jgi:autophagy-related protein 101